MTTWSFVPKYNWGDGPWQNEPDRIEWISPYGYPALMKRGFAGVWLGYIGISEPHPWHGLEYLDIPANIHGGITYAGPCYLGDADDPREHVCHEIPHYHDDVSSEFWWIGFDCYHAGDFSPGVASTLLTTYDRAGEYCTDHTLLNLPHAGVYRNQNYVRTEVEMLAGQCAIFEGQGQEGLDSL